VGTVLLMVALVMSLASCNQPAPSRAVSTPQAAVTQPGVPPQTGAPTPRPGETVVTVFTAVPQASPVDVTPTQDLAIETPAGTTPVPTAVSAPTATPGSSGGTTGAPIVHIVQPGETLSSIAARYGTTVQAIASANNIIDPNTIYVGQKLTIRSGSGSQAPSGGCRIRHTVQAGEWIYKIARQYGVSPTAILTANGMSPQGGNLIVPGQVLCIP